MRGSHDICNVCFWEGSFSRDDLAFEAIRGRDGTHYVSVWITDRHG